MQCRNDQVEEVIGLKTNGAKTTIATTAKCDHVFDYFDFVYPYSSLYACIVFQIFGAQMSTPSSTLDSFQNRLRRTTYDRLAEKKRATESKEGVFWRGGGEGRGKFAQFETKKFAHKRAACCWGRV